MERGPRGGCICDAPWLWKGRGRAAHRDSGGFLGEPCSCSHHRPSPATPLPTLRSEPRLTEAAVPDVLELGSLQQRPLGAPAQKRPSFLLPCAGRDQAGRYTAQDTGTWASSRVGREDRAKISGSFSAPLGMNVSVNASRTPTAAWQPLMTPNQPGAGHGGPAGPNGRENALGSPPPPFTAPHALIFSLLPNLPATSCGRRAPLPTRARSGGDG